MTLLRRLSVWIDEPSPGHFHWVLAERTGSAVWTDVIDSPDSFDTWQAAWEAGSLALLVLVNDNPAGPRVARSLTH